MTKRELKYPSGYDAKSQSTISLFAAQLDDQLLLLKESVAKLTVPQLEWQPQRGMNTIGMLLAHIAVVEVFWINVASKEIPSEPDGDEIELKIIGIRMDDDGLPIQPDGLHPATLYGKSVEEYFTMLDKARAAIHEEMQTWRDSELEGTFTRKRGEKEIGHPLGALEEILDGGEVVHGESDQWAHGQDSTFILRAAHNPVSSSASSMFSPRKSSPRSKPFCFILQASSVSEACNLSK